MRMSNFEVRMTNGGTGRGAAAPDGDERDADLPPGVSTYPPGVCLTAQRTCRATSPSQRISPVKVLRAQGPGSFIRGASAEARAETARVITRKVGGPAPVRGRA
jgi:hypothetical protein